MFGLFNSSKKINKLENETRKSFSEVKKDFESVANWIKHLDSKDKHLIDTLKSIRREIATMQADIETVKESLSLTNLAVEHQQVFKKQPVLNKQTPVFDVPESVQTPVQTGNFYDILNGLSSNERLIVFTLMNTDMKLSYEDIARLLGKERATIRGQINTIRRKSEGLIQELTEPNGKKRIFVTAEMREKLSKYGKVRAGESQQYKKLPKEEEI